MLVWNDIDRSSSVVKPAVSSGAAVLPKGGNGFIRAAAAGPAPIIEVGPPVVVLPEVGKGPSKGFAASGGNAGPGWGKAQGWVNAASSSGHRGFGGGGGHPRTAAGGISRVKHQESEKQAPAASKPPKPHKGGSGGGGGGTGGGTTTGGDPVNGLLFGGNTTTVADLLAAGPANPLGLAPTGAVGLGGAGRLSVTPEPTTLFLTATGLAAMFGAARKRARKR